MTPEDFIDYINNTPYNTNPAVLLSMVQQIVEEVSGGGYKIGYIHIAVENTVETYEELMNMLDYDAWYLMDGTKKYIVTLFDTSTIDEETIIQITAVDKYANQLIRIAKYQDDSIAINHYHLETNSGNGQQQ